jgi:rfaE bifunctional protein nucleotidyltransferase chain/domain/rfaE bifunctional protein kinase chain/domain
VINLTVIGDALLDRDIIGSAERLCPDAPVPVVDERATDERPGGAALTACLAAGLGADVRLIAPIADDAGGGRLRALLAARGVELIACATTGSTVEKVRVRVGAQTLLRVDRGRPGPLCGLPGEVSDALSTSDAVLVSDYGCGTTAVSALRAVIGRVLRARRPVVWDPHRRGAPPVEGTTIATPNRPEAAGFSGVPCDDLSSCVAAARALRASWRVGAVAVTIGRDGALLVTGPGAPLAVPVDDPLDGVDCCGAGDAFAAATAVALARGAVVSEAVETAVSAAAEFIGRRAPVTANRPTTGDAQLLDGDVVVATSGCFDLLHSGHVHLLQQARRLGDRLVVLLNSDASVRRLKGSGRPLQFEDDRAAVLRSLGCVDDVLIFDEDTPVAALDRLRPAVFVKGGDYAAFEIPEEAAMAAWDGTVVTLPFLSGRSTTRLLQLARGGIDVG